MQNQSIPVFCQRCNAQNNLAYTQVCWQCKAHLGMPGAQSAPRSRPAAKRSVISKVFGFISKLVLTVVVLGILGVAGFIFYQTNLKPHTNASGVRDAAPLPDNSWYKPSIWNLYRQKPTVLEILEKNNQATSKTLKPSDIQTVSLRGTISFAFEGETPPAPQRPTYDLFDRSRGNPTPTPVVSRWEGTDDFTRFGFRPLGNFEGYKKGADKFLRKIRIRSQNLSKTDVTEVFNGSAGWKEEVVVNLQGQIKTTVTDLTGQQLEQFKGSTHGWGNYYTGRDLAYSHNALVRGEVHFVVKNNDPKAPLTLYFDAVTGLLTKVEEGDVTCLLFPYSEHNEVSLPSTMYFRMATPEGKMMWMKMDEIDWEMNQPIDDSLFEKKAENQSPAAPVENQAPAQNSVNQDQDKKVEDPDRSKNAESQNPDKK
jgi:hypothetical protein